MRGVVLAGGTGTRLRPITFSMSKQLVPVANRPILHFGLEHLANAGVSEVAIVISPETGSEIEEAVGDGSQFGLHVTYITQDAPRGLAHALMICLPFIDGDNCIMYLGDNLVKGGVSEVVRDFEQGRPAAQILVTPVENPSAFGVAEIANDGTVYRLVEKPKSPKTNLALVGVYMFDSSIRSAIEAITPSSRGELEITDAIQHLIDSGKQVRASRVSGWWKDTGRKDDLLEANRLVLEDLTEDIAGDLVGCELRGPVRVGEGSRLIDCQITGPVVIGSNVELTRVNIGPGTSIGNNSRLHDATVESSIIMDNCEIHGWKLRESLLGRRTVLHGAAPSGFVEMTTGEGSEVLGE